MARHAARIISHLRHDLGRHLPVALHHPERQFDIAGPGAVRQQRPAIGFSCRQSASHAGLVVGPRPHHLRALGLEPPGKAFRHGVRQIDHRRSAKDPRTGCHRHAVIAGTGGDIGPALQRLAQITAHGRGLPRNRIGSTQRLEAAKPHPPTFILDRQPGNIGSGGQFRTIPERRRRMRRALRQQRSNGPGIRARHRLKIG